LQQVYVSRFKWLTFVCLAIVPLTAWLRIDQRWNTVEPGFNADYLNYGNYIQSKIPENSICVIDFDESKFISLYYLKRKGFSLNKEELNEAILTEYFNRGARYLLTENLSLNLNSYALFNFIPLFKNKICVYQISKK